MRVGQLSAIDFVSKLLASLLGFTATVYFARILGADALGRYYLVLSVVSWLSLLGTMGIGRSLVKRISEGTDTGNYLSAGATLISGFFLALFILLFVFRGTLNEYIGVPALGFVIVLLGVGLANSFVDAALQGQRLFHIYSLQKPVRRAIRTVTQVGAVIVGFELTGLIAGYAFGGIVAILIGLIFLSINIELPQQKQLKSLVNYAKFAWLGQLKSETFNKADVLILGAFVVPSLVGIYSIAWNIAGFLSIFSSSISAALFPEVSNISAQENVEESTDIVRKALAYAGLITIPGFAGGVILGENLLALYGQDFMQGSVILTILIAASVIYDYQKVIVSFLGAIDRPDLAFLINGVLIVSNIVLNVVLIRFHGWIGAAVATLTSAGLSLVLGYLLVQSFMDFNIPIRPVTQQVASTVVMSIAVLSAKHILQSYGIITLRAIPTISLIIFGATVYGLCLLAISPVFRQTVLDNISLLITQFKVC